MGTSCATLHAAIRPSTLNLPPGGDLRDEANRADPGSRRSLLLLGLAGYLVVKPNRAECKAAVTQVFDQAMVSDRQVDEAAVKAQVRWPCRGQSDADMKAIGSEVMAEQLPEILGKALEKAFGLR
jgi:hypothetical protein